MQMTKVHVLCIYGISESCGVHQVIFASSLHGDAGLHGIRIYYSKECEASSRAFNLFKFKWGIDILTYSDNILERF